MLMLHSAPRMVSFTLTRMIFFAVPRMIFLAVPRKTCFAVLMCFAVCAGVARSAEPPTIDAALIAYAQGRLAAARDLCSGLIDAGDPPVDAYFLRALCSSALENHRAAVADYDQVIAIDARSSAAFDARGGEQFMLGKFDASIADFDRAIELEPARERRHWRRGISCYYAGRYADGAKQFEGYQQVDGNDVENAAWRFLCMARSQAVETARREILPIRNDARVPMMQIYALYAGQGSEQAVLDAVKAGSPTPDELNSRQFYAGLYLGLYGEATGDRRGAGRHLRAAIGHKISHYMWDVARVHVELLNRQDARPLDK